MADSQHSPPEQGAARQPSQRGFTGAGGAVQLRPQPAPFATANAMLPIQINAGIAEDTQVVDAPAQGEAVAEPTLPAGTCITLPRCPALPCQDCPVLSCP